MVHRDGDHDLVNPVVLQRDLRLDVNARVPGVVQVLPDLARQPPVLRHVIRLRSVRRHPAKSSLLEAADVALVCVPN